MKSIAISSAEKVLNFPCLMIAKNNGCIILATGDSMSSGDLNGTCVNVGTSMNTLGQQSKCWGKSCFSLYTGKVELSN